MLKITIPTPCHEDWNKMTLDETGRHCSACAKSVIDFTGMSDEEVKYFFLNKKEEEKICGRLKLTQLHRIVIELPQNIFSMQIPLWKKFLAACLVVFSTTLFSCETKVKGDMVVPAVKTEKVNPKEERGYVGGLMIRYDSIPEPIETCTITSGNIIVGDLTIPEFLPDTSLTILKGDIDIIEVDSARLIQADTIPVPHQKNEIIFMGDSIYEELPVKKLKPDSFAKTKNPPKADSINCNTINNYH